MARSQRRTALSRFAAAGACLACLATSLAAALTAAGRSQAFSAWAAATTPREAGHALAVRRPTFSRPHARRGRVAREFVPLDRILRAGGEDDYSARWNYHGRSKMSPEEATRVLLQTGRLSRPIFMGDIKLKQAPLQRTVVANATERKKIARSMGIFAVLKLAAKVVLSREVHPVWKHDRILLYGKLQATYLQPNPDTNEPMEMNFPLSFKAAFREDQDLALDAREVAWNRAVEDKNMRPDIVDGQKLEAILKEHTPSMQIEDNTLIEAVLDNVLDVGEVVFQHFACNIDLQEKPVGLKQKGKNGRLWKRMGDRLKVDYGVEVTQNIRDETKGMVWPTPQEMQDTPTGDDVTLRAYTKGRGGARGGPAVKD